MKKIRGLIKEMKNILCLLSLHHYETIKDNIEELIRICKRCKRKESFVVHPGSNKGYWI